MTTARILPFQLAPRTGARSHEYTREPVSPFGRPIPARTLTPRELLHRHRMLDALGTAGRFTRVSPAGDY